MVGIAEDWNTTAVETLCQKPHRFERLILEAACTMDEVVKRNTNSRSDPLANDRAFIRDPSSSPETMDED